MVSFSAILVQLKSPFYVSGLCKIEWKLAWFNPDDLRITLTVQIMKGFCLWFQPKVKCSELRTKKKEDLTKQLEDLKGELQSLRVAKVTGGAASKLSKMWAIKTWRFFGMIASVLIKNF